MATVLQNNILDDLLPVVDDLRSDAKSNFGTVSRRVYIVTRTYQGTRQDGYFSETQIELTPPPDIKHMPDNEFVMNGSGKFSKGDVLLMRISLQFSEDQLLPRNPPPNQKNYVRMVDAHGENALDRLYHIKDKPIMDRHNTIGWIMHCTEIQDRNWNINGVK
jgi:hypothetical protein